MALATIIAGRYTGSWNALAIGICKDDGYRLLESPKKEKVNKSDAFAQTLIETVHQGVDWAVVMTLIEYNTAAMPTIISPWGAFGTLGTIAVLGTGIARPLVLTSTAGTPAVASPATFTGTLAELAPESNVDLGFTSAARQVPVRLDLLPDYYSQTVKHFVMT